MAKLYPYKIEQPEQIRRLYKKESSLETDIKETMPYFGTDSLQLKLNSENILQGIIFSEIFGKPKSIRMRRR